MTVNAIEFTAEVRKINTMADGSVNVILNLPEQCREQAKVLIDWHHMMVRGVLEVEREGEQSEYGGRLK